MAFEFDEMIGYARQFADGNSGMELAFVFSEWEQEEGFGLVSAYPVEREDQPPTDPLPLFMAKRLWVQLNEGAWQQLITVPQVTAIGLGLTGVVVSGVDRATYLAGWKAKGIGAGYITAPTSTMDQINSDRTTGVALIRIKINDDDGENPLEPSDPFTDVQITALNTWLGNHGVTPNEFAGLFNKTAVELAADMRVEPRWKLARALHEKFS